MLKLYLSVNEGRFFKILHSSLSMEIGKSCTISQICALKTNHLPNILGITLNNLYRYKNIHA